MHLVIIASRQRQLRAWNRDAFRFLTRKLSQLRLKLSWKPLLEFRDRKKGIFPCLVVIIKADICWLFIVKNQRIGMILIFLEIR